ncbi:MAG: zinc ribbon domain-containing protein [Puniceicoccaceae bacterium]
MTTYVYETIPADSSEAPKVFEVQQSIKDAPLTVHPETGEPVRRVILGGYGLLTRDSSSQSASASDCGPGCCCN